MRVWFDMIWSSSWKSVEPFVRTLKIQFHKLNEGQALSFDFKRTIFKGESPDIKLKAAGGIE